ncbi:ZIP family metal transporter [Gaetbulibacter aestuarii]|uniref:ZIP family metal transporter n=1 Tax=Gaetbulibacter aestuarii TaxID=1502358 RepID=A0ABW7MZA0_9FLAO
MINYILPVSAVILGIIIAFLTRGKKTWNTKLLLAFSGSFLLALTLFELLPEVYQHLQYKLSGLFIMCGILLQIVLELFSKGAEHGHVHIHEEETAFPWLLFISLCIHSFLEGFPIHEHNDMVFGVLVHKIPIATLVSLFLFRSGFNQTKIIGFLLVFALMTPLGTLVSNTADLDPMVAYSINAMVIGIFFHISTTILFESGEGHKFNLNKFIAIILGVAIAYFI